MELGGVLACIPASYSVVPRPDSDRRFEFSWRLIIGHDSTFTITLSLCVSNTRAAGLTLAVRASNVTLCASVNLGSCTETRAINSCHIPTADRIREVNYGLYTFTLTATNENRKYFSVQQSEGVHRFVDN